MKSTIQMDCRGKYERQFIIKDHGKKHYTHALLKAVRVAILIKDRDKRFYMAGLSGSTKGNF